MAIQNYPLLDDFHIGTGMVDLASVKMNLSYKDLLLVIGVVVALIIVATALVFRESDRKESRKVTPKSGMASPSVFVKRIIRI